jgi:hypothetical protein
MQQILYELYVKCGSAGKGWRKFYPKLPGIEVPSMGGWVTSGQ